MAANYPDVYTPEPWWFLNNPFATYFDAPYMFNVMFPYADYLVEDGYEFFQMPHGPLLPFNDYIGLGNVYYWNATDIPGMGTHQKHAYLKSLIKQARQHKGMRTKAKCTDMSCACFMQKFQTISLIENLFNVRDFPGLSSLNKDQLCLIFDHLNRNGKIYNEPFNTWGLPEPWWDFVIRTWLRDGLKRGKEEATKNNPPPPPPEEDVPDKWDWDQFALEERVGPKGKTKTYRFNEARIESLCREIGDDSAECDKLKNYKEAKKWFNALKGRDPAKYKSLYNKSKR